MANLRKKPVSIAKRWNLAKTLVVKVPEDQARSAGDICSKRGVSTTYDWPIFLIN